MNKISYNFEPENSENLGTYPAFRAVVNGQPLNYFLIPSAFYWSTSHEGIFPILNCSCGYVGCGGLYLKVKQRSSTITWESAYIGEGCGEDLESDKVANIKFKDNSLLPVPIVFNKHTYIETAKQLLKEPFYLKEEAKYFDKDIKSFEQGDFFFP